MGGGPWGDGGRAGQLLGVGALKRLDEGHAEVKSMHTAEQARRQGIGRAMVERSTPAWGPRRAGRSPTTSPAPTAPS